jgi:outer membrane protein assembly factor BamD
LALEELQLFVDDYPNSELIDSCNNVMDDLRAKLEFKQYNTSKMYFKMENFRAAATSLKSTMQQFPNSKFKEELMFMLVKSSFLLAKNSIESKKEERYEDTIKTYHKFVSYFPNSLNRDEVESYFNQSRDFLVKREEVKKNKG